MTKTMKAAVVHGFRRPLTIDDIPIPDPGPEEVLVKVIACGVCHTDLHAADGDWPVKPHVPFVPGHEVAGVVAALGPGVKDFKEGDPVGVAWLHDSCLRCEYCETGWEALCERQRNTTASTADSPNISLPPPTSPRGFTKAPSHAHRADPVCRGNYIQRTERDTGAAGRMGRDFWDRRPRASRDPVCEGYGPACRGHRCCPRKARTGQGGRCRNSGRCSLVRRRLTKS